MQQGIRSVQCNRMQGGSQQPLGDMQWRRLGPTIFISSFHELIPWHGFRCPSVCPSVSKLFAQIASSRRQMAGS